MNKIYPIFITIICALIVFVNAYAMGSDTNQRTALGITTALMFLSILSTWVVYFAVNEKPAVEKTTAEPDEIAISITVRNNRTNKEFKYTSDTEFGLGWGYDYCKSGEFLRITKETENGSLTVAVLTEHDIIDVKYGYVNETAE